MSLWTTFKRFLKSAPVQQRSKLEHCTTCGTKHRVDADGNMGKAALRRHNQRAKRTVVQARTSEDL